jgi:DNA-binding NarL/FixJ family response regulator
VAAGASNKDIGRQLGLSEQTVKNHLSHVFDEVGVSGRLELAFYPVHHRLLEREGKD